MHKWVCFIRKKEKLETDGVGMMAFMCQALVAKLVVDKRGNMDYESREWIILVLR